MSQKIEPHVTNKSFDNKYFPFLVQVEAGFMDNIISSHLFIVDRSSVINCYECYYIWKHPTILQFSMPLQRNLFVGLLVATIITTVFHILNPPQIRGSNKLDQLKIPLQYIKYNQSTLPIFSANIIDKTVTIGLWNQVDHYFGLNSINTNDCPSCIFTRDRSIINRADAVKNLQSKLLISDPV